MELLESALFGCIFFRLSPSTITVVLGNTNKMGSNPNKVKQKVNQTVCHPLYNTQTSDNDIGLVKLSSPVASSDYISTVCLAEEDNTFPNGTFSWVLGTLVGELTVLFTLFQFFVNVFFLNLTSHFSCLTLTRW